MFAKVFAQIFDSSIADDYILRHVFEDLLKLADIDGVVDMTPEAIACRTRAPLKVISDCLAKLAAPDPRSRSPDEDGRRIVLIDSHRSWGWRIVNYVVYREMRDEDARRSYMRDYMRNYRDINTKHVNNGKRRVNTRKPPLAHAEAEAEAEADPKIPPCGTAASGVPRKKDLREGAIAPPRNSFQIPTRESVKLLCAKIGLPDTEAERFVDHYESNGWKVGRNPMRSWTAALSNWKRHYESGNYNNGSPHRGRTAENSRNVGTYPTKTDYAAVLAKREREALARQVAQDNAKPPATATT